MGDAWAVTAVLFDLLLQPVTSVLAPHSWVIMSLKIGRGEHTTKVSPREVAHPSWNGDSLKPREAKGLTEGRRSRPGPKPR